MEEKDFFDRFIKLLENEKTNQELENIHDALIYWIGVYMFNLDSDDMKDRIVRDDFAEGVDAIWIDSNEFEMSFIQALTKNDLDQTKQSFPENKIKLTLEGVRLLIAGDYKGRITPKLENLTDEYHDLEITGNYKVLIRFLTLSKGLDTNKFIDTFKKDFPQITVEFIDFKKIYDFYTKHYLVSSLPPPKKISLEIITNILKKDTPIKAHIFTCKGRDLARIYDEHGESIFQQNVRHFLGARSRSINYQIKETASDAIKSRHFWYFNNGITMICKKINIPPSQKNIILEYPQIINGAQTTYSLHNSFLEGKLKDDAEVLIKAIVAADKDFIESVTLFTNSQNAIKLRDLCSNDEIQKKLHKIITDSYNYFYERKRGEFNANYPTDLAKKNKFGNDYKTKIIDNENAAQTFLALFLNKPAEAKGGKGRIFIKESGGFYKEIFNENDMLLPEKLLVAFMLFRYIANEKKDYTKQYKSAEQKNESEKKKIYELDFLLHSEYFIFNLYKDFLKKDANILLSKKEDILQLKSMIESNDKLIKDIYEKIVNVLTDCISQLKQTPGYYHNKFFKSEKSIAIIRSFVNKKYNFVEVIT